MHLPQINYLAVLVTGFILFVLGGLWYSPLLFARRWIQLQGKNEEQMKADAAGTSMPFMYLIALICGLLTALAMAIVLSGLSDGSAACGASVGALCWLGFAGATSYTTALFSMKSKQLWLIDSGYNLVSFVIAGVILAVWK